LRRVVVTVGSLIALVFGALTLLHGITQSGQVSSSQSVDVLIFNLFSFVSVASYLIGVSIIGLSVALLGLAAKEKTSEPIS